jgi:Uma2 family endonuclease
MGTTTKLTFEQFQDLPEREGVHYELDEGELLLEASPAARHNLVRQRIAMKLAQFVESNGLGTILEEMDFRLDSDTVRNPDVAFVTEEHLKNIDLDVSPIEGAPALAVEVISPTNTAQDIARKTQQYLEAGSHCVWLVYPDPRLRCVEIHSATGVRRVREPEELREQTLLPGFTLSVRYVFDGKSGGK